MWDPFVILPGAPFLPTVSSLERLMADRKNVFTCCSQNGSAISARESHCTRNLECLRSEPGRPQVPTSRQVSSRCLVCGGRESRMEDICRVEKPIQFRKRYLCGTGLCSTSRAITTGSSSRLTIIFQVLLIKWLGTHKEYDSINVEEVTYDEGPCADPSH